MKANVLWRKRVFLHFILYYTIIYSVLWMVQHQLYIFFSCARNKCNSITVNVIALFAIQQMLDELKSIEFLTIMVVTSNHKNVKLVPILIWYFNPKRSQHKSVRIYEFKRRNIKYFIRLHDEC